MAVKIRLKRMGNRNRPFFRIVVADSRSPRDGRFLETLGHYDPVKQPEVVEVNRDLALKWLRNGAQVSETARSLLKKTGIFQEFQAMKALDKRSKQSPPSEPVREDTTTEVSAFRPSTEADAEQQQEASAEIVQESAELEAAVSPAPGEAEGNGTSEDDIRSETTESETQP